MSDLDEKIPTEFVPPLTRRERIAGWFWRRGEERWRRRVRWRAVGTALLGAMVLGYLALATGAFLFVRYARSVETVSWSDIAWPPHWERYRRARGEKFHAEAKRTFEAGHWREALVLARSGVSFAPENREGRLLLVKLLFGVRRPAAGREVLVEGMRYQRGDVEYMREVLRYLFQAQEDQHIVAIARRALAENPPGADIARMSALAGATACFFRGHFDEAEDFLAAVPGLERSREGRLLGAKAEWERGFRELALAQLRQLATDFPHDPESHRELAQRLQQHGRHDEARRVTLAFQLGHPDQFGPRLGLLGAYRAAGERERFEREVTTFLADFAENDAALLALAEFAANQGEVQLAERVHARAAARPATGEGFVCLSFEAMIVARDYRRALERIGQFIAERPNLAPRLMGNLNSLQAVAHAGLGDRAASDAFLNELLTHADLRADNLVAVANRFMTLEATAAAARLLARACEIDPQNQAALMRLVEIEAGEPHSAGLAQHVRRLVTMRRPAPDVLRVASVRLGSDIYLFSSAAQEAVAAAEAALQRVSGGGAR